MSKLKQVLRMFKNGGMSNRKIAETVDLDKNTVNKYVNQAKKDSMSIDELLSLDDPVLAHRMVGGEKAFLDFAGGKMQYVDIDTGEIHDVEVFVACLPATDYGFAMAVLSQKVEDFLLATERFFEHIGGVPKILVPDNLKSAVIKREKGMPELNKIFEDFCNHYGCVAIPARPVHPKDKSLVEDHVKIFYRRVVAPLRNEIFYSIDDINAAIFQKMRESNQRRMQQRPQTREELFLAIEKPNLSPLPKERYEVKFYTNLLVKENCCIYLGRDMHYYSVPYKYIGTRMQVIFTATLVKIYTPEGELVRCWDRDRTPGQYSTKSEDIISPSEHENIRGLFV